MNKFVLLASTAAIALVSGVAGAATLTNTDKHEVSVSVEVGDKKETVKLKSGDSYDSKDQAVIFSIGKDKAHAAKGDEKLIIKNGKIEEQKVAEKAPEKVDATAKADAAKPAEKTVTPETQAPAAGK